MTVLDLLVTAIWVMLPAYVPNNAAVLGGGGRPIDGGRTLGGRRLLGDGKTWRGTVVGSAAGVVVALLLNRLQPTAQSLLDVAVPTFPLVAAIALSVGAMLGDILASFLKRRSGRERGAAFPGLDQLDFVVTALALVFLAAPAWSVETFSTGVLAIILVVTPVLHLATNAIAYGLGLKNEPW